MKRLARLHLVVGLATVIIFLGTGVYLLLTLPPASEPTHLVRMTYRSAHVYLLLTGLINIAVGTYLAGAEEGWRRRLQIIGSLLLLAAPGVGLLAFIFEPPRASLERPLTLLCVAALLAGTFSHLPSRRWK